jgi:hypothetical protein
MDMNCYVLMTTTLFHDSVYRLYIPIITEENQQEQSQRRQRRVRISHKDTYSSSWVEQPAVAQPEPLAAAQPGEAPLGRNTCLVRHRWQRQCKR